VHLDRYTPQTEQLDAPANHIVSFAGYADTGGLIREFIDIADESVLSIYFYKEGVNSAGRPGERHDIYTVTFIDEMGGRAVHAYHTAAALALDHVCLQTLPVRTIDDEDAFVLAQIGLVDQIFIDRYASDVIQIRLRHGGLEYHRFQQKPFHIALSGTAIMLDRLARFNITKSEYEWKN
jgi:hypothetical protein